MIYFFILLKTIDDNTLHTYITKTSTITALKLNGLKMHRKICGTLPLSKI